MVRLAKVEELERLLEIFEIAKVFMKKTGNPTQWDASYPGREKLTRDIENESFFVIEEDNKIVGCFALIGGDDPTYAEIEGEWLNDSYYGTIHRVASDGTTKGVFKKALEFARSKYDHLRIDTHNDNKVMQNCILNNGFTYTGVIYVEDGTPRLAYEWVK